MESSYISYQTEFSISLIKLEAKDFKISPNFLNFYKLPENKFLKSDTVLNDLDMFPVVRFEVQAAQKLGIAYDLFGEISAQAILEYKKEKRDLIIDHISMNLTVYQQSATIEGAMVAGKTATEGIATIGEIIGMVGIFCGLDSSGFLIKFAQMLKIVNRLRLINIRFSNSLDRFMDSVTGWEFKSGIKPSSSLYSLKLIDKSYGKLSKKQVPVIPPPLEITKISIYLISWSIGVVLFYIRSYYWRKKDRVSPLIIKSLHYWRRLHINLLILTIPTTFFVGLRTLLHLNLENCDNSELFSAILTRVCVIVSILHICILVRCSNIIPSFFYRQKKEIKKRYQKFGAQEVDHFQTFKRSCYDIPAIEFVFGEYNLYTQKLTQSTRFTGIWFCLRLISIQIIIVGMQQFTILTIIALVFLEVFNMMQILITQFGTQQVKYNTVIFSRTMESLFIIVFLLGIFAATYLEQMLGIDGISLMDKLIYLLIGLLIFELLSLILGFGVILKEIIQGYFKIDEITIPGPIIYKKAIGFVNARISYGRVAPTIGKSFREINSSNHESRKDKMTSNRHQILDLPLKRSVQKKTYRWSKQNLGSIQIPFNNVKNAKFVVIRKSKKEDIENDLTLQKEDNIDEQKEVEK